MKRKILNILSAVALTASLTVGALPAEGLKVRAAGDINETVQKGLAIRESEINQLLTEDLTLPASVDGLTGAKVEYSIEGQPKKGTHGAAFMEGNTLKVTRPYAGEGNYKFNLVAKVTADGATATKTFPMTVREGLSGDSYAGYVYVCFAEGKGKNNKGEDYDVQQIHFFLSEDGLNWTALNGCQPAFLAGSDFINSVEKCAPNSVNYNVTIDKEDIPNTVIGDASALFPFEGRDQGVRDPYLIRGCKADGSDSNKVWLLATDLNTHSSHYHGDKVNNSIAGDTWGLTPKVGVGSQKLFIWETEDWIHWERRYVDVASKLDAGMAWAPEAIYNPEKDNYLLYWSGKVDADNITRNRLYCCETSDFVEFGEPKLYEQEPFFEKYAPSGGANENDGYGNIDTSQIWVAGKDANGKDTPYGTLFRVVKDETLRNSGNALLNIRLMSANSVLDPNVDYDSTEPVRITPYEYNGTVYAEKEDLALLTNDRNGLGKAEIVYNWFKDESTGNHFEEIHQKTLDGLIGEYYEGATIFKFIDRDEWCVMIDHYAGSSKPRYEPFVTTDLSKEDSIEKMPAGTYSRTGGVGCHGGMIPITVDEYNNLIKYYNDKSKMTGMNAAAADNYHEISPIYLDTRTMDGLAERLEKAAANGNYSAGTKAQMTKLAAQAKKLAKKEKVSDSTEMDNLTARAEKLMANTVVEVPKMYADHVELSASAVTLCTKKTEGLTTTATLTAEVDVDEAPKTITWKSSDNKVATVENGKITAKKAGTATITATAVGGAKATCKVTVKGVPSKVTLKKKSVSLKKKKTYQIKPGIPKGTVCSSFSYKSNKPKIASVSKSGLVTAKKKGTAKITVKAGNNSKAKATLTVKVK